MRPATAVRACGHSAIVLDDATLAMLRARPAGSRRVERVATPNGDVVVKRQRPRRGAWRGAATDAVAALLGQRWLRAVPARGGAAAQAVEVRRLRELRAAGVPVPALLHVDADFIVLERVPGASLAAAPGIAAWRRGLAAIAAAHDAGQYLSQAFARNLIDSDRGVVAIDFEDDPLEAMALADAQTRDWLAYLHSTLWAQAAPPDALHATFAAATAHEDPQVRHRIAAAARRLAWLRHLPRSRRPWGREVVGLAALAAFLATIA